MNSLNYVLETKESQARSKVVIAIPDSLATIRTEESK